MEKEFAPYELALRMKQLGFDEECFYVKLLKKKTKCFYTPSDYDDFPEQKELEVGMPLYQQAFRWFREKYKYCSYIKESSKERYRFYIEKFKEKYYTSAAYSTYEEAEAACLEKLIEIVEQKQ
jgi:hypothetical protein